MFAWRIPAIILCTSHRFQRISTIPARSFNCTRLARAIKMVRGGPANRAVKRAKVFALAKVRELTYVTSVRLRKVDPPLGISRSCEELLQYFSETRAQSFAISIY